MNSTVIKKAKAYKVEIFIGGDLKTATRICQDYCNAFPLCVTIEPTNYIYTGGNCAGVRVGLINYARFPENEANIWFQATDLARHLKAGLNQGSFTVQDHETSMFFSDRDEDQ